MNADLGQTQFTPEEIDALRHRLRDYKAQQGLSWNDLAKVTDIASGTLSGWVPGTYNAGKIYDNQDVPGKVHRFFQGMSEQAELAATLASEPDFQETTSARRMLKVMALAHLGDMALISTTPGCGKTSAVKQYAATRPQVFVATCSPSTRGVNTLLIEILKAMGERDAKGTPQALSERIRTRVRGARALIVVDEAQHASAQALDELRAIHDDTECGVVLAGDEFLLANLKRYPQLFSRLGVRHVQTAALNDDVIALASAWGVKKGPELDFLLQVARKPGALRSMTKTIRLAKRLASAGSAPMEVADLRDAFAQRYGDAA